MFYEGVTELRLPDILSAKTKTKICSVKNEDKFNFILISNIRTMCIIDNLFRNGFGYVPALTSKIWHMEHSIQFLNSPRRDLYLEHT